MEKILVFSDFRFPEIFSKGGRVCFKSKDNATSLSQPKWRLVESWSLISRTVVLSFTFLLNTSCFDQFHLISYNTKEERGIFCYRSLTYHLLSSKGGWVGIFLNIIMTFSEAKINIWVSPNISLMIKHDIYIPKQSHKKTDLCINMRFF